MQTGCRIKIRGRETCLTVYHGVTTLVVSEAFTLSPLRQRRLLQILTQPHITFAQTGIDVADLVGVSGEPHEAHLTSEMKARTELESTTLPTIYYYTTLH